MLDLVAVVALCRGILLQIARYCAIAPPVVEYPRYSAIRSVRMRVADYSGLSRYVTIPLPVI
jgi:hypothetical protein